MTGLFSKVEIRYALRACLFGVAAAASALAADADWKHVLLSFITGALAYAGIGAAVPAVEPQIGAKLKGG